MQAMISEIISDVTWSVVIMGVALAVVCWKKGRLDSPLALAVLARTAATLTLLLGGGHLVEIAGGLVIGTRIVISSGGGALTVTPRGAVTAASLAFTGCQ